MNPPASTGMYVLIILDQMQKIERIPNQAIKAIGQEYRRKRLLWDVL
jgi:hypothetical protein